MKKDLKLLTNIVLNNSWGDDAERFLAVTEHSKICRCGREYPLNALPPTKEANGIAYFDCECKAIVFIPLSAIGRKNNKKVS